MVVNAFQVVKRIIYLGFLSCNCSSWFTTVKITFTSVLLYICSSYIWFTCISYAHHIYSILWIEILFQVIRSCYRQLSPEEEITEEKVLYNVYIHIIYFIFTIAINCPLLMYFWRLHRHNFVPSSRITVIWSWGEIQLLKLIKGSCKENDTPWHFTVRTLSKSNRFRTRKHQNASWGYVIILKFSCSKTIGFWQSSHRKMLKVSFSLHDPN